MLSVEIDSKLTHFNHYIHKQEREIAKDIDSLATKAAELATKNSEVEVSLDES